jgi:hypothetical protein
MIASNLPNKYWSRLVNDAALYSRTPKGSLLILSAAPSPERNSMFEGRNDARLSVKVSSRRSQRFVSRNLKQSLTLTGVAAIDDPVLAGKAHPFENLSLRMTLLGNSG